MFQIHPPKGLGIMPLLVGLASPVAIIATLFLAQTLQTIPKTFFKRLAASLFLFLLFESLTNLVS